MSCCCINQETLNATDKFFSKQAKRFIKRFHRRGLPRETRLLVEGIKMTSFRDKSILEIGCGVGGLHLTLMNDGAKNAVGIDISKGMIAGAKELSAEFGYQDRTEYFFGDYIALDEYIKPADITVLDKVVCCYSEVDTLLEHSMNKTTKTYALSFPKPSWYVKSIFSVPIFLGKLLKWSFHPYWHDWNAILKNIKRHGFIERDHATTFIWATYVFERAG